jgi:hypothetical protein
MSAKVGQGCSRMLQYSSQNQFNLRTYASILGCTFRFFSNEKTMSTSLMTKQHHHSNRIREKTCLRSKVSQNNKRSRTFCFAYPEVKLHLFLDCRVMPSFTGLLKKLFYLILILAVAIPLRYGSTDYRYLRLRLFHSALSLKYSLMPDPARPMLTSDYLAFETILRLRPILATHPEEDPHQAVRRLRSSLTSTKLNPRPALCQVDKEVFTHDEHSIDAFWVNHPARNFQKKTDRLLLYFHGGGYLLGNIDSKFPSM